MPPCSLWKVSIGAILLMLAWARGAPLHAEDGSAAWLRYTRVKLAATPPRRLVVLDRAETVASAAHELQRGLHAMAGVSMRPVRRPGRTPALLLGTVAEVAAHLPGWKPPAGLGKDGYVVQNVRHDGHIDWVVAGRTPRGALYGAFALLERLGEQPGQVHLHMVSSPAAPIRWVDQWDNPDGSIERGYAGRSIFFDQGHVRANLARVSAFGRLLASVGVDGLNVNNVNASPKMLTPAMISGLARIANALRPWGVRLAISVDLRSPEQLGGLKTFNPKNPKVIAWWRHKVDALYRAVPDFAGFTVKADSEGQPGPSQYGLSPASAANMLARALAPHGGVVMYRAFVYNHHLDWHDHKADRARAAYDIFHPLDGHFARNVVIQIKNGPIDFQVREPASPLFAGLRHSNQAMELEVTQEYTGQQRQTVYLVPMWKATLDFDMRVHGRHTPVSDIVTGRTFQRTLGGFAAVTNVGLDSNWLRDPLAMANLWGYARLAWNPRLSARQIADNWTRLTFGTDPRVVNTIVDRILLPSWRAYEEYTGPLGLQTLTDITGAHYGPDPQSAEHNGWGQWFRATGSGVGMDRTVTTGTGFIGQYPPQVAAMFGSLKTCPDDLLLFMHHVPYTHRLHDGLTVIQYLYDAHYRGAIDAQKFVDAWKTLEGRIDSRQYRHVLAIQRYQAAYAIVWRDAITRFFHRISGIADVHGRVGHYPDRVRGAQMKRTGYVPRRVTPWEDASNGHAETCTRRRCTASTVLHRAAGTYDIGVQYFDLRSGKARFRLLLNGWPIAHWSADARLPGQRIDGDNSTRHLVRDVHVKPGDRLTLVGWPQGSDPAAFDYVVVYPAALQSQDHN